MFTNRQIQFFANSYIDYALVIAFLIGVYGFRFNRTMHPIIYLVWITLFNNAILIAVDWALLDYHFYNPIQLLCLGWFFYRSFEDKKIKKLIPYILGGCMIFAILNGIFLQSMSEYPSNFIVLESLLLIIGATFLFIEKLDSPAKTNIFRNPEFVSSIAILSFNLFSFIYFLLVSYFNKHKIDQYGSIIRILFFANIIYYTLLVLALLFSIQKTRTIEKS